MKRKTSVILAALALALSLGHADAGTKFVGSGAVTITTQATGAGSASGYLGHIWNSTAQTQYIGCDYTAGPAPSVMCHARSETEQFAFCTTGSAFLAEALAAVGPDVRLSFTWNASGVCDSITVQHSSTFAPKL
ncbi:MAG TPA: hypothetical protein VMF52_11190 [Steroidobacteraceae bacterium]|nr:hypothetical protein [Steroidobacteraceae bacterium]